MTVRRKTANPIFQKPLTVAESEGSLPTKVQSRYLTCQVCGSTGGTLVKIFKHFNETHHVKEWAYECQDRGKCKIMVGRRR